ncbi:hypothetical protein [Nocardioides sp. AE5]|uniref:hypothetical protein n=1 Tax=Nocardioides sp. AE5 TaxID=2962573 RepID=UPI002882259D|nr:hypothetical protein [Nocardioides sp. AE5]MDT0202380.1 hypothetical protein [Nocardioides sp. AE5]
MNNPAERKLTHALQASSDAMADAHLDLGAVHDQAHAIRRRRRIGAGLGAAALVAAIAIPVTLISQDFGNQGAPAPATSTSPSPADPTTPSESETSPPETPETPDDPNAVAAALEQLPLGDGPQVAHVVDGTWHNADGTTLTLPSTDAQVVGAAWYHGGPLLVTNEGEIAGSTLSQYDASGAQVWQVEGNPRIAISNEGTRLAWWQTDADGNGEIHAGIASGMGEGEAVQETGDATYVTPIGFANTGELVYMAAIDEGPVVMATDFEGEPTRVNTLVSASGVDGVNNRVAGELGSGEGTTGAVIDLASNEPLWSKPGWHLGAFSPDGRYVVGFKGDVDPAPIAILDAETGDVVAEFDLLTDHGVGYSFDTGVVWEDDSTLLVFTYVWAGTDAEDHPGVLLRLAADGSVERASEVGSAFWVFAPRP